MYDKYLQPLRNKYIRFMEIGLGCGMDYGNISISLSLSRARALDLVLSFFGDETPVTLSFTLQCSTLSVLSFFITLSFTKQCTVFPISLSLVLPFFGDETPVTHYNVYCVVHA